MNSVSRTFLGEILDLTRVIQFSRKFHRTVSRERGGGKREVLLREKEKLKSLTDWHVDSEENDKGAMAEHCALR